MRSLPAPDTFGQEAADRLLASLDSVGQTVMSRRRTLQITAGVAAGSIIGGRLPIVRDLIGLGTADAAVIPSTVVLIYLDGGNDGLNTLVPLNVPKYRDLRGTVAIDAAATLPINADYGLHSSLPFVQSMWANGQAAFVRGIGYGNNNLSHFSSIDHWHYGYGPELSTLVASPHSGWVGRYADTQGSTNPFTSIAIGPHTPISLRGNSVAALQIPITSSQLLGNNLADLNEKWVVDALKSINTVGTGTGALGSGLSQRAVSAVTVAPQVATSWNAADGTPINRQLTMAANLINARLGVRVISVTLDGFDTHAQQPTIHARLLSDLNAALTGFFARIDPSLNRSVAVMTYSEFGRRAKANNSNGTDHGSSSVGMLLGANVAGGMYGEDPGLAILDDAGNTRVTTDFRRMYATVLAGWLEADPAPILGAAHAPLPLFAAPAGVTPTTSTVPTTTLVTTTVSSGGPTTLALPPTTPRGAAPQAGSPSTIVSGRPEAPQAPSNSGSPTVPRGDAPQAAPIPVTAAKTETAPSTTLPETVPETVPASTTTLPAPAPAPASALGATEAPPADPFAQSMPPSTVITQGAGVTTMPLGQGEPATIPTTLVDAGKPAATPQIAVSVSVNKTAISATVLNGPLRNDTWVGLFAVDAPHSSPIAIRYLNNQKRPGIVTRTSGTVRFDRLAKGTYGVRVFSGGTSVPQIVMQARVR
jgi:uncharacterized protein (DUF1501 family)